MLIYLAQLMKDILYYTSYTIFVNLNRSGEGLRIIQALLLCAIRSVLEKRALIRLVLEAPKKGCCYKRESRCLFGAGHVVASVR
jgi:hypothetical protein